MNEYKYVNLPPFKWFVLQNFPFIEADFDAITYYQLLCKLGEEINKIIDSENKLGSQMENVTNAFISLQDYVANYFENLDVQEEIDNKLDEMAESGDLAEIIAEYVNLQSLLCYDTIEDLKSATNLQNGSYAKTYGFYSVNDKGGAIYKIRTITNEDVVDEMTLFAITNDNTLIAELMTEDSMNVLQFGAKGNGTHDDTANIQCAINNCSTVLIPSTDNYYKVTDTITLNSNQKIIGEGEKSKILMPNDLEETIFEIKNKDNILIDSIKLCNESCQESENPDLSKNKIITTETANNITIQNCYFENAYSRGIQIFKTKGFRYINNVFKNATYEMLFLLQEVEDVLVDNSVFDTILGSYSNSYLFCSGRIDETVYGYATKNVHVQNSKFLNNPNWEGIDTHACLGFYCENNYIENCACGIMARTTSTSPVTTLANNHGNIYIRGNVIKGIGTDTAINAGCVASSSFYAENIVIENNVMENVGKNNNSGGINVSMARNVQILNNTIKDCPNSPAITLTLVLYANVKNNNIYDVQSDYIISLIAGNWFINVLDNVMLTYKYNKNVYGIYGNYLCIAQVNNNNSNANTKYRILGTNMSGSISSGTIQMGKLGNYVKNQYEIITHYCIDTVIRPSATGNISSVSLSGTNGTKILTGTNASYYLTEGEEITIPGANTGGTDLTTVITKFINRNTFEIADEIETTVSSVTPSGTASTWVEV